MLYIGKEWFKYTMTSDQKLWIPDDNGKIKSRKNKTKTLNLKLYTQ